jgi:hypothetical protein
MAKFTIQPHGRLQEWIAHEKGYFRDAGLDYEFRGGLSAQRKKEVDASGKVVDVFSGAFESYQQGKGNKGVKSDISCACHWAVNQASTQQIGRMWGKSYVVTPGGVMVPQDSPIRVSGAGFGSRQDASGSTGQIRRGAEEGSARVSNRTQGSSFWALLGPHTKSRIDDG